MASSHDHVYVFGGCLAKGRSNALWEFSLGAQQWRAIALDEAVQPAARGGPGLCWTSEQQIHMMFGFDGKHPQSDHYVYHLPTATLQRLPEHPASDAPARSVTGVVSLRRANGAKDAIFVFGGECEASAQGHEGAGQYLGDAWLFDGDTATWQRAADGPSPRGWCSLVPTGDHSGALLFGGFDGVHRLADVFIFHP
jgi:hypothetical protein